MRTITANNAIFDLFDNIFLLQIVRRGVVVGELEVVGELLG